ncbi:putative glutamate--cysteine ligase 2 [Acrocarpospora phusangensis]|uniref:Putative glutamate--cysteine ligase 2 n=1 Tax=Acrocarpospora phusangensis TaxID=1070424 RepID=A0A919UNV9_9ACTN|nr:glutamate--cysteine ligase [Acrocarpospora phusangensis]GIH24962.1 putative glutamate--cysteine ligase 2 [Acrocarpospora phusangensis]
MAITVGVEEEFLLLRAASGEPAALAGKILAAAGGHPGRDSGGSLHQELFQTQAEAATGVCATLADLRAQLLEARILLADAARAEGLDLVSVGTPVLAEAVPDLSDGERFARIGDLYRGVIADYQSCGCHVHVGVRDRDTAVAVMNHLRPWLPTLLALSANSPFDRGHDSGYASWRMVQQSRFPGSGVPPWFDSAAAYERQVDRLIDCGVLVDEAMSFWMARPGVGVPTVEVRAADAAGTADEAVLQAALTRALVCTAEAALARGREAPRADGQTCAAAVWNAARHGLDGPGVDVIEARAVPAVKLLDQLLAHVRDALADNGDMAEVEELLAWVRRAGTGAERQRRAATAGPEAVLDLLRDQTVREKSA